METEKRVVISTRFMALHSNTYLQYVYWDDFRLRYISLARESHCALIPLLLSLSHSTFRLPIPPRVHHSFRMHFFPLFVSPGIWVPRFLGRNIPSKLDVVFSFSFCFFLLLLCQHGCFIYFWLSLCELVSLSVHSISFFCLCVIHCYMHSKWGQRCKLNL